MSGARILTALGPSQLVTALAAWDHLATQRKAAANGEDILVLGGFCAPGKTSVELESVCRQIARTGNFSRIVSTVALDEAFEAGKLGFDDYVQAVARETSAPGAREVWACRNMQPFHEAVLFAWPDAKKICYGDLGMIDLDGTSWCRPIRPSGYAPMHEIVTHGPVEVTPGAFAKYPVTQVPTPCLMRRLDQATAALADLEALCQEALRSPARRTLLACLSNLTESCTVPSVEEELRLYEACLLPHLDRNTTLILKGHPRETLDQAKLLTARLRDRGFDARWLDGLSALPIDLFSSRLKVDCLLTLLSHAGVFWRLLQPRTDILMGVPGQVLSRFIPPEAQQRFRWTEAAATTYLLTLMATRRHFQPFTKARVRSCLELAPAFPLLLPGRAPEARDCLREDPKAAAFYAAVVDPPDNTPAARLRAWLRRWLQWRPE